MTWLDFGGQRSRSQQAYICGGKGIHIDAGALKSHLVFVVKQSTTMLNVDWKDNSKVACNCCSLLADVKHLWELCCYVICCMVWHDTTTRSCFVCSHSRRKRKWRQNNLLSRTSESRYICCLVFNPGMHLSVGF